MKQIERIGGFGGKSDILAESQVYGGSPDFYKKRLKIFQEASVEDVHMAAKKWLSNGKYVLVCQPFPEYSITGEDVDRTKLPEMGQSANVSFPDVTEATLKNGLKIKLAKREDVPTVVIRLMVDGGYAGDQFIKPGAASLAMNLLDEGTKNMNALEISDRLQILGASMGAYSDLDNSYVYLNTLKQTLGPSLDLLADLILNPAFDQKELDRLKKEQISGIQREKAEPFAMALRIFPKVIYPEEHAYAIPMTGSGTVESVESINREDLISFYETWFKPNHATLLVVGNVDMEELQTLIEERLNKWKKGTIPVKNLATVPKQPGSILYLMDRPESLQSVIIAGYTVTPYGQIDEIAQENFMKIFGGTFTSRINMNLREDKHWSYGAGGFIRDAKSSRPLMVFAPVQTDKTRESIEELRKEFREVISSNPISPEEFEKEKQNTVLQLPGRWETNNSISSSMTNIEKYGLPENYYDTYSDKVQNLLLDQVNNLANSIIDPDKIKWVVVGDKSKIMNELKKAGFDKIIVIDEDGNRVSSVEGEARKGK